MVKKKKKRKKVRSNPLTITKIKGTGQGKPITLVAHGANVMASTTRGKKITSREYYI
jgi:hypothetical protein